VKLVGKDHRDVVGARIEATVQGRKIVRFARGGGSYASANDPRVLAGLGDSSEAPTVRVHWPGGGVEEWRAVAIDRWMVFKEGEGEAP